MTQSQTFDKAAFNGSRARHFSDKPRHAAPDGAPLPDGASTSSRSRPCLCGGAGLYYGDDNKAFYCDCRRGQAIEAMDEEEDFDLRDQMAHAIADAWAGGME